jgi:hypothetical protein
LINARKIDDWQRESEDVIIVYHSQPNQKHLIIIPIPSCSADFTHDLLKSQLHPAAFVLFLFFFAPTEKATSNLERAPQQETSHVSGLSFTMIRHISLHSEA